MKKILMIAALFSLSLSVYAQREKQKEMLKPEQHAERMTNKMVEKLELSDEQKEKVYQVNLQNAQAREVEMESRRAEAKQRREWRQGQTQRQTEEIEAILTLEQAEKWAEMRDSDRQRGQMVRNRRGAQKDGEFKKGKGHQRGYDGNRGSKSNRDKRGGQKIDN